MTDPAQNRICLRTLARVRVDMEGQLRSVIRHPSSSARNVRPSPYGAVMTTSNLASTLAMVGSDIEQADGEVTVMLIGPAVPDCGPNTDGQVVLDILDGDDEEPFQYAVDLTRNYRADSEVHLRDCAHTFLVWLHDHGVAPDETEQPSTEPVPEQQLTIAVTFEATRWRSDGHLPAQRG
jgi:hypothetical protein